MNDEPLPAFSRETPEIQDRSKSTTMPFLNFYGLHQHPFGMTPDPAYLYASRTHAEALESLALGIADTRGFLALVAEPGMGKTTLLYQLIEQLRDTARSVLIFQTECTSREFIEYILQDLGVDTTGMGLVAMHGRLNEVLFEQLMQGKRFVLVIDEAQNLDDSVLETVRMLSNFETHNAKLLQIILAGQPRLAAKLAQPRLSQLRQRISVLTHLEPFTLDDTALYIDHRLRIAGFIGGEPIFDSGSIRSIARHSKGIPRNINNICHNALLLAYSRGVRTVTPAIVQEALERLDMESLASGALPVAPAAAEPAMAARPPAAKVPLPPSAPVTRGIVPERSPRASLTYGIHNTGGKLNLKKWHLRSIILVAILFSGMSLLAILGRSESKQRLTPQAFEESSGSLEQFLPADASAGAKSTYDATPQETGDGQVLTVAAGPQQTLKDLSLRYVGRFDEELSRQIRGLNPDLKDPDHLEAGQLIRIPLPPGAMRKANDTGESTTASRRENPGGLFTRFSALLRDRK